MIMLKELKKDVTAIGNMLTALEFMSENDFSIAEMSAEVPKILATATQFSIKSIAMAITSVRITQGKEVADLLLDAIRKDIELLVDSVAESDVDVSKALDSLRKGRAKKHG